MILFAKACIPTEAPKASISRFLCPTTKTLSTVLILSEIAVIIARVLVRERLIVETVPPPK